MPLALDPQLEKLLVDTAPYLSCDECFERLDEYVELEPMHPAQRCTPESVAGHSLYERAHPYLQAYPGGVLDTSDCRFEAVSAKATLVTGMRWEAAERYTEFADTLEQHNNHEVASLFRTMAEHEGKHARRIMAEMGWKEAPALPAHAPQLATQRLRRDLVVLLAPLVPRLDADLVAAPDQLPAERGRLARARTPAQMRARRAISRPRVAEISCVGFP